jgi:hypothetical protein
MVRRWRFVGLSSLSPVPNYIRRLPVPKFTWGKRNQLVFISLPFILCRIDSACHAERNEILKCKKGRWKGKGGKANGVNLS